MNKLKFIFIAFLLYAFLGAGAYALAAAPKNKGAIKVANNPVNYTGVIKSVSGTDITLTTKVKVRKEHNKVKKGRIAPKETDVIIRSDKAVLRASAESAFEGSKKIKLDITSLKVGDRVSAMGTVNPDGSIDARTLRLLRPSLSNPGK